MRIDFNDYNIDTFNKKEVVFCGIDAFLITPENIKSKFTQHNKILRSSIWTKKGVLLSASFPKFKNAGEDPENFPMPESLEDCKVIVKEDGSTMIVDYVNDQLSMRTRGTSTYKTLHNNLDFDFVINKYPLIGVVARNNPNHTLLFEIVTPNQKIVLDYGDEPDVILIGAIDKKDYSLAPQEHLDNLAQAMGVKRPEYYNFNTLEEIFEFCNTNKTIEGFCLYFNEGQSIVKVKTDYYLSLHKVLFGLRTIENVVDLFLDSTHRFTQYEDFYNWVKVTLDYEVAERIKDEMEAICEAHNNVLAKIAKVQAVVFAHSGEEFTRKDRALEYQKRWSDWRLRIAFLLSDKKGIDDKNLKYALMNELQFA